MSAIWITGTGVCTPLGNSLDAFADSLFAGKSGISQVKKFDAAQHPSQIAAQIDHVPTPFGCDAVEFGKLEPVEQLVSWCCTETLRDAGLWDCRRELRIGVVIGIAAEWLLAWEADGLRQMRTRFESSVANVANNLGLTGPALTLSAACASGNFAFAMARSWLRAGLVDACIAGGCDRCVTPLVLAGFGNLRALSRRNDSPATASRPFDRGRDGFVVGEGGVTCMLEREPKARRRGAVGLAEIAGFGASSDAHHMVIPSPDTTAAAKSVLDALADARINASDVDYINAHGTSTPVGDVCEAKALRNVFGSTIDRVPVSSTKSMTGHLLAAAAAAEAAACIASIRRGIIAPTTNLDDPDPECQLHHVANTAHEQRVNIAVSNSFGFGGSNTSLVLRRVA